MTDKKKKLSGFARGVIIYAAALIIIFAVLLGLLYGFVSAYEKSRPYNTVESYLSSLSEEALPPAAEEFIKGLDSSVRPEDESRAILTDILKNAEYSKDVKNSSSQRLIYSLKSDGVPIGSLHLAQSGSSFGLSFWDIIEENLDLSSIEKKVSMDLPEGYTLSLNGRELGSESVSGPGVKYETLLSAYEYYPDIPTLLHYESGSYIGEADIKVLDREGREVPPENLNESLYLNNCSSEKEAELKAFSDEVISRYVQLCANIDQNEVGNYMYMKELIIPESQLHERMRISFYALGYSVIRSCEIVSTEMNICADLGNGKYFTDLSYAVETWGLADPVTTEQNIQLVISYDELNQLKAEAMFNY